MASRALAEGRAIVVPTDTVYGVAVALSVPHATRQLFALKDRPDEVPIAVLVASAEQAGELVEPLTGPAERLVGALWPGPLTVVLRRRADVHVDIGGDGSTIGVRCPDHAFLRALAAEVGPLATTSANRHGEPTPPTARAAAAALTRDVALVVDGTDPALAILRAGPITPEQVQAAALP
jgi:tRNA threonylcarbamoyl adenosine modification protein (Sua5/YciO/YrdC/YwlC family)